MMKTFFAISVLIAVIYLAFPQAITDKVNQYMPQRKIEQAATSLLSQVDQKLNKIKLELAEKQEQRIRLLEDKLTQLQQQIASNQQATNNLLAVSSQQPNEQQTQLSVNSGDNDNYSVSAQPILPITQIAPPQIQPDHGVTADKLSTKRQAMLKDIAERMNQASLLAAFNN